MSMLCFVLLMFMNLNLDIIIIMSRTISSFQSFNIIVITKLIIFSLKQLKIAQNIKEPKLISV